METFYEIKPSLLQNSAVALGFFDGVHLGHQAVIAKAVEQACARKIPAVIATFKDHPQKTLTNSCPQLLTTLNQRLELFADLGVDYTLALNFNEELSRLSPIEYIQSVLLSGLGMHFVSIGYNHHFGKFRQGNPQLLQTLGKELGFDVHVQEQIFVNSIEVSSSQIRQAVSTGNMQLAKLLLNRPYAVVGTVIEGDARGSTIGFPTANLKISPDQLLPLAGVYAGVAHLPDGQLLPAVVNLGYRPTFGTQDSILLEAHILDYHKNLYAEVITIEFWKHLRPEKKFNSLEDLKKQIGEDCRMAKEYLLHNNDYHQIPQEFPSK